MTLHNYHVTDLADGRRIRWVYDEHYQSEGSFAYDTEAETAAAVAEEQAGIDSGRLVALGAIVEHRCPCCSQWVDDDSLWGIVAENRTAGLLQVAKDVGVVGADAVAL